MFLVFSVVVGSRSHVDDALDTLGALADADDVHFILLALRFLVLIIGSSESFLGPATPLIVVIPFLFFGSIPCFFHGSVVSLDLRLDIVKNTIGKLTLFFLLKLLIQHRPIKKVMVGH